MQTKFMLFVSMVLFFLSAISCVVWSFNIYREMNWPTTEAVVLNTKLENRYDEYKYLYIEYAFEVDKKKYVRVEDLGSFHPPKLGQILEQYKKGTKIEIAYDPAHPAYSMLRNESNTVVLVVVAALPFVLTALGLLMLKMLT